MSTAATFENPANKAFVAAIESELLFAEVLIRRSEKGFELRHIADREFAVENLRLVQENQIRALAQFTADGAFRPLKSAPNLQRGWRLEISKAVDLDFGLNQFYPGAVADWFAVRNHAAVPTHYREFTKRQTGMYRVTALLADEQVAPVIRACCHPKFCLKQRFWTIDGLAPDAPEDKSLIPCLEPCAILLEFARKAFRLAQAETSSAETSNQAAMQPSLEIREADFENPANPRRLQLAIEKQTSHS